MHSQQLIKLVDQAEEKYGEYVFARLYGDGSGGLYDEENNELVTWDDLSEMEKNLRLWIKE